METELFPTPVKAGGFFLYLITFCLNTSLIKKVN